jgi:hypothetical protein
MTYYKGVIARALMVTPPELIFTWTPVRAIRGKKKFHP